MRNMAYSANCGEASVSEMLTDVPDCMHGPAFQVLLLAFSSLVHVNDACQLPA